MTLSLTVIGLVLLGSLSPLLTFLWLFQLKEWRLDRLSEHLRHKNAWQTIGGPIPITVIAFWCVLSVVHLGLGIFDLLILLAGITAIQFVTKRQRFPDWTKKTLLIGAIAAAIDVIGAIIILAAAPLLLPLFAVIQAPLVIFAWALTLPLDHRLKQQIFAAAAARRTTFPNLMVIGIVGSVGKTTTKELISAVLEKQHPLVTPAHVNTELGIANWFLRETKDWTSATTRPLVVEMGAYKQGEIRLISGVIRPTIAVVTALGSDHLALFGSEAAIDAANSEILDHLPSNGAAIALADNSRAAALVQTFPGKTVLTTAEHITETTEGLHFTVGTTEFDLPLAGQHNAGNAALAIAVADTLGISRPESAAALATVQPLVNTFNVRVKNGRRFLDDTYNISPLSLKAALTWAGNQPERPRILVTAGLLELGGDAEHFMRELGTYAQGKIEQAVILGDKHQTEAFMAGFGQPVWTELKIAPDPGSLLLCVGRLPRGMIDSLLP